MPDIIILPATGGRPLPPASSADITLVPAAQNDRASSTHPGKDAPVLLPDTAYAIFTPDTPPIRLATMYPTGLRRDANRGIWQISWRGTGTDGGDRRGLTQLPSILAGVRLSARTMPHLAQLNWLAGGSMPHPSALADLIAADLVDADNARTADRLAILADYGLAWERPPGGAVVWRSLIAGHLTARQVDANNVIGWQYDTPLRPPPEHRTLSAYLADGRRLTLNPNAANSDTGLELEKPVVDLPTARVELMLQIYRLRRGWRAGTLTALYDPEWQRAAVVAYGDTDSWVAYEIRHQLRAGQVSTTTLSLRDMPVLALPPEAIAAAP